MSNYGQPLPNESGLTEFEGLSSYDLLARMIYAEARGESWAGKQGVAHVAKNRKAKNSTEFGGGTYEGVILKDYAFEGMTTSSAREPDLDSSAWDDCLYIAMNMNTQANPIGTCLWFHTNALYNKNVKISGDQEQYNLGGGYRDVVEKYIIDNHTFFKVSGY